ncbi:MULTISPECIES: hypothetical protein [Mesorhizobium]|nr:MULTISPECIES: hypothetical protein [Mesorhizobium]
MSDGSRFLVHVSQFGVTGRFFVLEEIAVSALAVMGTLSQTRCL